MGDEIKDMKESIDKITENVRSLSRMIKAYDNGDIVWLGFDGDMIPDSWFGGTYIYKNGKEYKFYGLGLHAPVFTQLENENMFFVNDTDFEKTEKCIDDLCFIEVTKIERSYVIELDKLYFKRVKETREAVGHE